MSLILEALKKLDRDKQAPEKGLVVLGATAWAARSEGRPRLWLLLLADLMLVALGGALVFFWLRPSAAPAPASPQPPAAAILPPVVQTPPQVAPLPPPTAAHPPVVAAIVRPTPKATVAAAPEASPIIAAPRFVLQAVTEQDGEPVALISDRLLRVGEGFDGMRVVRITPTEVEVEIEATQERRTLTF